MKLNVKSSRLALVAVIALCATPCSSHPFSFADMRSSYVESSLPMKFLVPTAIISGGLCLYYSYQTRLYKQFPGQLQTAAQDLSSPDKQEELGNLSQGFNAIFFLFAPLGVAGSKYVAQIYQQKRNRSLIAFGSSITACTLLWLFGCHRA